MADRGRTVSESQLRSVAVLAVLAGAGGWVVSGLYARRAMALYLAVVAAVSVAVAFSGRVVHVQGRPRRGVVATGELAALVLLVMGGLVFFDAAGLLESSGRMEMFGGAATVTITWVLGQGALSNLEGLTAPTDTGSEITTPLQRLSGSFLRVGIFLALASAVAGGRSALALVLFWMVGLIAIGFAARRRAEDRWRREHSRVDSDVATRWATNLFAALILLAVAAGIFVPLAQRLFGPANRWLLDWRLRLQPQLFPGGEPVLAPPSRPGAASPSPNLGDPAAVTDGWLRDLLVFLAFGAIFAAVWIIARRRGAGIVLKTLPSALRTLPRALWLMLVALWRMFGRIREFSPAALLGRAGGHREAAGRGRRPAWGHDDPVRKRIGIEYFAFLTAAARKIRPRGAGETPHEFQMRVEERLPEEPAVAAITDLYVEARYSPHHMDPSLAELARRHRRILDDRFSHEDG